MKKTLLLATALVATLAANAQNPIVPVQFQEQGLWYIPKTFADAPYLVGYERNGDYISLFRIYNHNLQQVSAFTVSNGVEVYDLQVCNLDEEFMYQMEERIQLTQTLFNSDSRFEYIARVRNSEGNCIRFDVVADDGTVVSTFGDYAELGERWIHVTLYKIANTCYLHVWNDGNPVNEWYRIDRQTQQIDRVEGLPFNVFPTVADRDSYITVQFEDGTSATELQVIDAQGRTLQRIPVTQGQQEVKVSARNLRSGINFIGDRRHGAAKIIVR